VRADRRLLEAVFHELIHNAMEAMPSGGTIVLRVGVTTVDEPNADAVLPTASGPHVTVDVEDTGVGMTGSVRQSMFDPFFTTKPVHAAAGLGLAAVYGIVGAHRGGIEVESEPGRGTRVRVLLPQAGQECRGASRGAPASHHPLHVFH
jgi:signal transduction histidine kinase